MLFFDTESDGLVEQLTKIHCIRAYDTDKHAWLRFDPDNLPIEMGVKALMDAPVIVGHNAVGFDVPAITKVYPWFKPKKVLDSLIMAKLIFGDIKNADYGLFRKGLLPGNMIGRHSLEAWGYRIGVLKGVYGKTADWNEWTPEMSEYCERDVTVLLKLWDWIARRNYSEEAAETEHIVQAIVTRQQAFGFPFDIAGAEKLYMRLIDERTKVEQEGERLFPPFYKWDSKVFTPKRDNNRLGYHAGGDCCRIHLVTFKPTSSQHVYSYLRKKYGWEPEEFTEKSEVPAQWRHLFRDLYQLNSVAGFPEPKMDDEVLRKLDYPEAPMLARAALLQKRIGQLAEGSKAWLKVFNDKTGAIHGSINPIGAVTRRMSHYEPNLSQVPAIYSEFGPECRALFVAKKGWSLVGADASALEMCMLGHFLAPHDGGSFIKSVLEGKKEDGTDPHSRNAKILGLSRDDAKTWFLTA